MKNSRCSSWFVSGVLVLTMAGPMSFFAYAATPQQSDQKSVLLASSSAPAAPSPAQPAPLPPAPSGGSSYRWNGFYVGISGGYTVGRADTSFVPLPGGAVFINLAPTGFNADPRGGIGGLQTGYNWESGGG